MPFQSGGFHYRDIRRRIYEKHEKYPHPNRIKRFFDGFIYVAAIMAPVLHFPQLYKIYRYEDASGVSFISWISFSVISLVWFGYGFVHEDKAIMFMNILLMVFQVFIAVGVLLYG